MNLNDYERLLSGTSSTELATLKSTMEADKIKSLLSNIPEAIGAYVRCMHEEEKERREQLLRSVIPKTTAEYLKDQLGTVGVAGTIADSFKFHDRDYLERILGRPAYELTQLSDHVSRLGSIAETLRLQNETFRRQFFGTDAFEQAKALALASERYHLDDYLDSFRTAAGPLTDKMLYLGSLDSIRSPRKTQGLRPCIDRC